MIQQDSMSASTFATDSWARILCQKRELFDRRGLNAISLVDSRDSFRDCFEALCDRINENRTERAQGKLDISFDHIDSFIHILESATLNQGPTSLIWAACFAVIQSACTNGSYQDSSKGGLDRPDGPVQLVADLNNSLPNFDDYLQHGNEPSVQEALKGIFVSYIDCCLSMIPLLSTRPLSSSRTQESDSTSPQVCIQRAAEEINAAKAQLEKATSVLSTSKRRARVPPNSESPKRRIPASWPSGTQYQVTDAYSDIKNLGTGTSGHVEETADASDRTAHSRKRITRPKSLNWAKFRNFFEDETSKTRKAG